MATPYSSGDDIWRHRDDVQISFRPEDDFESYFGLRIFRRIPPLAGGGNYPARTQVAHLVWQDTEIASVLRTEDFAVILNKQSAQYLADKMCQYITPVDRSGIHLSDTEKIAALKAELFRSQTEAATYREIILTHLQSMKMPTVTPPQDQSNAAKVPLATLRP